MPAELHPGFFLRPSSGFHLDICPLTDALPPRMSGSRLMPLEGDAAVLIRESPAPASSNAIRSASKQSKTAEADDSSAVCRPLPFPTFGEFRERKWPPRCSSHAGLILKCAPGTTDATPHCHKVVVPNRGGSHCPCSADGRHRVRCRTRTSP